MTKRVFWMIIGIIATVAVSSVTAGYQIGLQRNADPQFVAGETATVAVVPTLPGFTPTWSGTGLLRVPSQVAPGAYLVSPDDKALGCVWQRLKKADNQVSSIIAVGQMAQGATPQLVTVEAKDRYLQFLGGCAFRKVS
jgi:hypothetical protein